MFDLGVLLGVPYIETEMGFDISPDGERVAFVWNPNGAWEIYEKEIKNNTSPRMISSGPGGKFHPRYSPDGQFLAYSVDFDGSERFHIFLFEFEGNKQIDLTPDVKSSLQANFSWSPDSRHIAYFSDQTGQFNVFILTLFSDKDPQAKMVFDGGYPGWKVRWSPDGSKLAIVVEASGIDYGTFILSVQSGEAVRICDENSPIDAGQVCWSPRGNCLAFTSDVHGFNNIGIYELATGGITWLTDGEGEKQFPRWSPDGTSLTYVFNRGAVSWLAVQQPGKPANLYQVEPGVHYLPEFTPDGKNLIFGFDNPRHPTDLWLLSLQNGKFTQLTQSLPMGLVKASFIMPEEITYPGMDGTPVPALLFRPNVEKIGPAVLLIHGGPDWFFEMTWYPLMAAMASQGWVVLVPNYRGSTGYGRDWQEASRFDFGGVDTDDVAAGAIFLRQAGLADPKRIGITGRSHGGYLTVSCLTRYPDLWAVGSAFVPFLNWFTNHEEIRPDLKQWDLENFGDPVENHDLWYERSPSFFLECVRAPLQLICGRLDARCPISDSLQAFEDLKGMGKTVDLVVYEDEGHVFLKKENVLDSELRRVAFLARYLK